jgi:hypothetical protein
MRREMHTARFAPSIMTPSVRLGFSPAAMLADRRCRREQVPSIRLGFSPAAMLIHCVIGGGSKYCSLRSQHHDPLRTAGPIDHAGLLTVRTAPMLAERASPYAEGDAYCLLRSQHQGPPPYGWALVQPFSCLYCAPRFCKYTCVVA